DLEADMVSPLVDFPLVLRPFNGRFQVHLARGGFLHCLTGETTDGSAWEKDWKLRDSAAPSGAPSGLLNWLPPAMPSFYRYQLIARLEHWLAAPNNSLQKYDPQMLRLFRGATAADIAAVEAREGMMLPAEY